MRRRDEFCHWLARWMPRRLRYWAVVVAGAEATCGQWGNTVVPELTLIEAMKRVQP